MTQPATQVVGKIYETNCNCWINYFLCGVKSFIILDKKNMNQKKKQNKPLISVIMPVFNGGSFLADAIESILQQTYTNFELMIINDNSKDSTEKIILLYKKKFPTKIIYIKLKNRLGAYGAANIGISKANGEFIALMDSDDVSHPQRFEKEVNYLIKNKEIIVVGSQAKLIDKNGFVIGRKVFPLHHKDIYRSFFEVQPIVHPSCMIRRSILPNKNKLYHNKYEVNDDYYTLFSLFKYGKFANLPDFLFNYRIHSGNSSLQRIKQKFFNTIKIRIEVVTRFGYVPSLTGILKFLLQILVITPMPEKVLFYCFMIIKGIITPRELANKLTSYAYLSYLKTKKYSFSLLRIFI